MWDQGLLGWGSYPSPSKPICLKAYWITHLAVIHTCLTGSASFELSVTFWMPFSYLSILGHLGDF